jgi:hypothetical protein
VQDVGDVGWEITEFATKGPGEWLRDLAGGPRDENLFVNEHL